MKTISTRARANCESSSFSKLHSNWVVFSVFQCLCVFFGLCTSIWPAVNTRYQSQINWHYFETMADRQTERERQKVIHFVKVASAKYLKVNALCQRLLWMTVKNGKMRCSARLNFHIFNCCITVKYADENQ